MHATLTLPRFLVTAVFLVAAAGATTAEETAHHPSPLLAGNEAVYVMKIMETECGRETVTLTADGWSVKGDYDLLGTRTGKYEGGLVRKDGALDYKMSFELEAGGVTRKPVVVASWKEGKLALEVTSAGRTQNLSADLAAEGTPVVYEDLVWAGMVDICFEQVRQLESGKLAAGKTHNTLAVSGLRHLPLQIKSVERSTVSINGKNTEIWTIDQSLGGTVDTTVVLGPKGLLLRLKIPSQGLEISLDGIEMSSEIGEQERLTLVDKGPWRSELSQPTYEVVQETKIMVPMRDGVKLATDVYRPEGDGPFPTILARTPYDRNTEGASKGNYWARRGYVFVAQDVRGRFASEGEFAPGRQEVNDGSDAIDWIAAQPWSNQKVGMIGASYVGWTQWYAAKSGNPHLKAIVPQVAPPDPDENFPCEGGVFILTVGWWAKVCQHIDGDGGSLSELPELDWIEAFSTLPVGDLDKALGVDDGGFFDEWVAHPPIDEAYWGPMRYQDSFAAMDIAALHISGWFDGDQPGAVQNFAGMRRQAKTQKARDSQYLIMGAWGHAFNTTNQVGKLDHGEEAVVDLDSRILRFFDRYLKDIDNGIDREDRVLTYSMGENTWHSDNEWPLTKTEFTNLYLGSDGNANRRDGNGSLALGKSAGSAAVSTYRYDPLDLPETNVIFNDMTGEENSLDQSSLPDRDDVLDFTSAPLAAPCEITGPIRAVLSVSTDAPDTDFAVTFNTVKPDGRVLQWLGGIQRLRYRNKKDEPVKPGTIVPLEIDVWATGLRMEKGDKIRIEVRSTLFPGYSRNLNTLEPVATATAKDARVATNHVHHTSEHPSTLVLPVIPREGAPGLTFETAGAGKER